MFSIAGRIFIDLKIDGNPIPNASNLVNRITMTEGMGALSPAIELVLNDYSGVLNRELALTDGNEITVTVGRSPQDQATKTRQYRLFGTRQKSTASGPQIQAVGIYDAPEFLSKSTRESFEANTQDVLSQIAEKCKLTFRKGNAVAEDKQIWLNVCKTRAMFVQDTVRHGRVNDRSAMVAMLTSLGELRYYDASELIETPKDKITKKFVHSTGELNAADVAVYEVHQSADHSTAGVMNSWQNYGAIRIAHSLEGEFQKFDRLDVSTAAGFLPINMRVKKTIENARIDYSPLDCGNTHKNYYKALYQNRRLLALFSEHVSVLVYEPTEVELLDVVMYRAANADPKEPVNKSDIYIVIGKTILIKNGVNYAERIELVRRSLTVKGESKLAGATESTNAADQSPTPDSLIDPTVKPSVTTMPTVNSISSAMAPLQSACDQMKAQIPDFTNSISFAMPGLQRIQEALKNNLTPQDIIGRVGQVIPALNHYKQMGTSLNNKLGGLLNPLALLRNTLDSALASTGIRQAAMTNPAGVLSSMTAAMMPINQQQTMANVLSSLVGQIKPLTGQIAQIPGGAHVQRALVNHAADAVLKAKDSSTTLSRMWNLSLSSMIYKQVPSYIPIANSSFLNKLLTTQYLPGAISTVPLTMNKQTSYITSSLLTQTDTKQPYWMPEEDLPLVIPPDAQAELDKLNEEIAQSMIRQQDMYPTDWTGD